MKTKVGLWMDHRKAVIVTITDKGEETKLINSNVEKQLRREGDSPLKGSYESQQVPSDTDRESRLTGNLNIYYDEVIASIHGAEFIFIFGPGEAKGELKKRIDKGELKEHIVGVETVDKMTDPQILMKVRQYFQENINPQNDRIKST
ncbi:MAG: hypothetical protein HQK77_07175 [Desulfobacterales bacterium]|nr:hypothetical protein [Desulfobacterales bacterium]